MRASDGSRLRIAQTFKVLKEGGPTRLGVEAPGIDREVAGPR